MNGRLITFEGNEGSGKSTQIRLLAQFLVAQGWNVLELREPGGTPIGEEIRHTLKHSEQNAAMTPEAELLLMAASRAQLVREVIRPALLAGQIVLCDRFHDSTHVYQGYGRELNLTRVDAINHFAIGNTVPDLTLLLHVPVSVSEQRREMRSASGARSNQGDHPAGPGRQRDRFEEADRTFFQRVEAGYLALAKESPERVKLVDATGSVDEVQRQIRDLVQSHLVAMVQPH